MPGPTTAATAKRAPMAERVAKLEEWRDGQGETTALLRNAIENNTEAISKVTQVMARLDERLAHTPTSEAFAHLEEKAHAPGSCDALKLTIDEVKKLGLKVAGAAGAVATVLYLLQQSGILSAIKKSIAGG